MNWIHMSQHKYCSINAGYKTSPSRPVNGITNVTKYVSTNSLEFMPAWNTTWSAEVPVHTSDYCQIMPNQLSLQLQKIECVSAYLLPQKLHIRVGIIQRRIVLALATHGWCLSGQFRIPQGYLVQPKGPAPRSKTSQAEQELLVD